MRKSRKLDYKKITRNAWLIGGISALFFISVVVFISSFDMLGFIICSGLATLNGAALGSLYNFVMTTKMTTEMMTETADDYEDDEVEKLHIKHIKEKSHDLVIELETGKCVLDKSLAPSSTNKTEVKPQELEIPSLVTDATQEEMKIIEEALMAEINSENKTTGITGKKLAKEFK